ncbi:type II toxin-antitoxin system RelE/ParE family toxin [Kiritimatiellota bacterium B12222]|nr:type II toxin-antitoxin system RelE/ParE family toxin [Kiritimatiellota bacterium B12222]
MPFSFHPDAEKEFLDAVSYYEDCEPGLGIDLAQEVHASIKNAVDYPSMWPLLSDEIHRCLVHRFPYGVIYSPEPHGILILAVMHLHRKPDYWKHRKDTGRTNGG